jgi:hypothetical protein
MNSIRRAATFAAVTLASLLAIGAAMAFAPSDQIPQVNPFALEPVTDVIPSELVPTLIVGPLDHNWKCKWVAECPKGLKRTPDGNYAGCEYHWWGCGGGCTQCTGSTNGLEMCVPGTPNQSCYFQNGGGGTSQPVDCGTATEFPRCKYFENAPAGEPYATPNGCYCAGSPIVTQNPCFVQPCTILPTP